ncbi:MAG: hypothetical protein ACLR4Z_09175 [Butyricicoccaceae bacterium]
MALKGYEIVREETARLARHGAARAYRFGILLLCRLRASADRRQPARGHGVPILLLP